MPSPYNLKQGQTVDDQGYIVQNGFRLGTSNPFYNTATGQSSLPKDFNPNDYSAPSTVTNDSSTTPSQVTGASTSNVSPPTNTTQPIQQPTSTALQVGSPALQPSVYAGTPRFVGDTGSTKDNAAVAYSSSVGNPLKAKYQGVFNDVKNKPVADQGGQARQTIADASISYPTPKVDPVTNAVNTTSEQLFKDIQQRNNIESTTQTVQDYTNSASSALGIPSMKTELMNIQNVMNGSDNDIRNEITASGGFATESQIEALVAGRNKTLILKATNIQNALANAQDTLGTEVSAFSADRANAINTLGDRINGDQTALSLFQTIQSNAKANYDKILTISGWSGLSQTDPSAHGLIEATYGLTPGTLSDPTKVQNLQNSLYKTQSALLAQQKFLYSTTGSQQTSPGTYGTATSTISQLLGIDPSTPLSSVDPSTIIPAIIQNEGSSPSGVRNNPGNIKFTGLPGQINSGVKASDGGTFANYSTPQAGQQAIANIIQNATSGNSVYGPNPTLGDFIDKYTNTAPTQSVPGTTGNATVNPSAPGYSSTIVAGRLTQAAIDQAAIQYATTGTLPTGSRSSSGAGAIEAAAIKNRAAELNTNNNISTNKATLSALSTSLKQQVSYQETIQRSINTVDDNLKILQQASKGVNNSSVPIANQISNNYKLKSGDGALNAFNAAIQTVRTEYATILGRGTPTDQTRSESANLIPDNINLDQLNKVIAVLQKEGSNVSKDATSQVQQIQGQINSIVSPETVTPQQANDAATQAGFNYNQMKADGYSDADIMTAINNANNQ